MPESERRYALLGTATSLNFSQFGARVVISPFVLAIAAAFGVAKGEVGATRTVYVLLGSVGNVATGVLAEHRGWPVAFGVVAALMLVAAALVVGDAFRSIRGSPTD